ncbi:MAG: hypothetical protein ACYTEQ_29640, partial [Planctomycetota bacterium]
MNIIGRIASLVSPQANPPSLGTSLSLGGYASSPTYGVEQLNKSYATTPILRDVTSKIAYSVATTRWVLYQISRSKADQTPIKHLGVQTAGVGERFQILRSLADKGRLRELESHALLDFLNHANPQITGFNARRVTQLYLDLPGEVFWVLERNRAGAPYAYWPIPPHWVQTVPDILMSAEEIRARAR